MSSHIYTAENLHKCHYTSVYYLLGIHKRFIGENNPEYLKYYERLAPVLEIDEVNPIVYFGIINLYCENYTKTAALVSSDEAYDMFKRQCARLQALNFDLLKHVVAHYKLSQEEIVMNELVEGEDVVATLQKRRNMSRYEAVEFCVDFNMVSDIYVLTCKEFENPLYASRFLDSRSDLKKYKDTTDPRVSRLITTIKLVRDLFYRQGLTSIIKPKKTRRYKQDNLGKQWQDVHNGNF